MMNVSVFLICRHIFATVDCQIREPAKVQYLVFLECSPIVTIDSDDSKLGFPNLREGYLQILELHSWHAGSSVLNFYGYFSHVRKPILNFENLFPDMQETYFQFWESISRHAGTYFQFSKMGPRHAGNLFWILKTHFPHVGKGILISKTDFLHIGKPILNFENLFPACREVAFHF